MISDTVAFRRSAEREVMQRLSVVLLLTLASCTTPVPIHFGVHGRPAPIVGVSNPGFADGDPIAGRREFIAAQCIDCHRVAEDPALPRGARAIAGPVLSDMARYTPRQVARRITSRATGAGEELFDRNMKDYAQPITAKQLVDIVAYLRNPAQPRG